MTWTAEDQAIAGLRAWLVEQGFVVLSDRYDPDHFGDQIVELARPIAIRLVRDRNQWAIEIVGSDGEWADLSGWLAEIGKSPGPALSVADQARLLQAALATLERRVADDKGYESG